MAKREIRKIEVKGDLAFIPLTRGKAAIIDAKYVHLVDKWNWTAVLATNGKTFYAARNEYLGGGRKAKKYRYLRLHRVIMDAAEDDIVDHKNGDGLDCREKNLRKATVEQNQHNASRRSDNKSGFKGVVWHKASGKYVASIKVSGLRKHLGCFDDPKEAHVAYVDAARKFFGEFMRAS